MAMVMHEIVGAELDALRAWVDGYLRGDLQLESVGWSAIHHLRAVAVNPEAVQETDWYAEAMIDHSDPIPNIIVRYSEAFEGPEVPGVTGWNLVIRRDADGQYHPWGDPEYVGGSGPAFNGCFTLESQAECTEWVDRLLTDDLTDIWL